MPCPVGKDLVTSANPVEMKWGLCVCRGSFSRNTSILKGSCEYEGADNLF